jgi:hypothetical protein
MRWMVRDFAVFLYGSISSSGEPYVNLGSKTVSGALRCILFSEQAS